MTAPACLRCGDFARGPIAEIAICSRCLETNVVVPLRVTALPPRELALRQDWPAYVAFAVTFVAVVFFGWSFVLPRVGPSLPLVFVLIVVAALLGLLGFVIGGALSIPFTANLGYDDYKRVALAKLAITAGDALALVYFTEEGRSPGASMLDRGEIGGFACAASGLVFLGLDGSRFAHGRAEISRVSVERLGGRPWRHALRVELAGRALWFSFLEGRSFAANRAKAEEASARLR